jgi:chitin synthase
LCFLLADTGQVSWGTKGSDKAEVLPSVSSKKPKEGGDQALVEDTARTREDLDNAFKETVTRAVTKVVVKEEIEKPTMDDQNKTFRTRLVAFWMLTNAGLAVAIENINGLVDTSNAKDLEDAQDQLRTRQNLYFEIILYSTFGLALVRFIGVSRPCCAFRRKTHRFMLPVLVLLAPAQPLPLLPS